MDLTAHAVEEFRQARLRLESTEHPDLDFRLRSQMERALDKVTATARVGIKPHHIVALEIAGFRKALDIMETEGAGAVIQALQVMHHELEAAACHCGGSGEVPDRLNGWQIITKACPDCKARGEEEAQLPKAS